MRGREKREEEREWKRKEGEEKKNRHSQICFMFVNPSSLTGMKIWKRKGLVPSLPQPWSPGLHTLHRYISIKGTPCADQGG